jgi:hypothetical protein
MGRYCVHGFHFGNVLIECKSSCASFSLAIVLMLDRLNLESIMRIVSCFVVWQLVLENEQEMVAVNSLGMRMKYWLD